MLGSSWEARSMGWDLHETGERWPDNCQLATETAPRTATHVSTNSLLLRLWFAYSTRAEVATQGTPGSNSVLHKMAGVGDGIQVFVQVLRNATWSLRSFTSSAQLGESFQRGGANVRGSLSSMLLTGALLRRAACKGKYTATGGMFEGLYVFVAWSRKGSDFKPWLIEKADVWTELPFQFA